VPSTTGGLLPLSSTETPLPGKHLLFGENNGEEEYVEGEAMSLKDIDNAVAQFATAAINAINAGFTGVEIHGQFSAPLILTMQKRREEKLTKEGGNGYLLDTFVHSNINNRTDQYGGSLKNRLRFPLQIVDAVAAAIGSHRTAIRIAPFHVLQQTLDNDRIATFSTYTAELEKRGLAYVHMVEPRYDQLSTEGAFSGNLRQIKGAGGDSTACNVQAKGTTLPEEFSLWTFRRILKTTLLVGAGGYSAATARKAIEEGRVDIVAIGRYFTSNPDLVRRFLENLPLTPYDRSTFYTKGVAGYLGWTCYGGLTEDGQNDKALYG
jgi:2,4-dienoyl-CoA reductase-like NADH-dependent reductase (Old Yellow Enzyme family)